MPLSRIQLVKGATYDIVREEISTLGIINLPLMMIVTTKQGDTNYHSSFIDFLVLDLPSPNNAIIERQPIQSSMSIVMSGALN